MTKENPLAADRRTDFGVEVKPFLVIGLGAFAFGRERRTVRMLGPMRRVRPYFIVPTYSDGSVAKLLAENGLAYEHAPFGYLGRARPRYTLVTLSRMPLLHYRLVRAYFKQHCRGVILVSDHPVISSTIALLFLRYVARADVVPYFGDVPGEGRTPRLVGRILNLISKRVIVNSAAVKEGLVKNGVRPEKVHIVYNGLDLKRFGEAAPLDWRLKFSWPADAVVVGFIGQFTIEKGIWDLVNAANIVLGKGDNCRFVLIGRLGMDDDLQREVQAFVEARGLTDHVVFHDWLDRLEGAYAGMDIVVVPSRLPDAAPNVAIEAMASGVPVIATSVGGIPELVADGEAGILVERGNPGRMAEAILQLANDRELRQRLGQGGRKRAGEVFDLRKNLTAVEAILVNA